jgi:acetyltransferase-like isoleucine patch superfamily enzyme
VQGVARTVWTIVSIILVESAVVGLAALPPGLFWQWVYRVDYSADWIQVVAVSLSLVPAYLTFGILLMILSAASVRLLGWRTRPGLSLKVSERDWQLLNWVRYMVSIHLVRVFAGTVFRATPLWTFYLRLNGATIGRGVYVNSVAVSDHSLLEFGDGVVIGEGAHVSGHVVERGLVKTAPVKLGRGVTVGLDSVVGIGVEVGDHTAIGGLSLVPKFTKLEANATYVGIPVRKIERTSAVTT